MWNDCRALLTRGVQPHRERSEKIPILAPYRVAAFDIGYRGPFMNSRYPRDFAFGFEVKKGGDRNREREEGAEGRGKE